MEHRAPSHALAQTEACFKTNEQTKKQLLQLVLLTVSRCFFCSVLSKVGDLVKKRQENKKYTDNELSGVGSTGGEQNTLVGLLLTEKRSEGRTNQL